MVKCIVGVHVFFHQAIEIAMSFSRRFQGDLGLGFRAKQHACKIGSTNLWEVKIGYVNLH